jgi:hypothetical protein
MHTLIPIVLLPYLQCVAITETKGSLDELDGSFHDLIEFNPYKIVSGLD